MMKKSNISYVLELTKNCNNNCIYCYNVWKANPLYPNEELTTDEWKKLIDKLIAETSPRLFTLSGGEPLLKKGYEKIISHIAKYHLPMILITNGTLITDDIIKKCLKYGVINFELPILGDNAQTHDNLTKNVGSWEKVINSIQKIKKNGGNVTAVFVLNKYNIDEVEKMSQIAIALANNLLVNFFNVGGMGIKYKDELSITAKELEKALLIINNLAKEYEISISCGIPLPKCVLDTTKFENVRFGECQVGGEYPYYAIDPAGNLRFCNHSELILGNLLNEPIKQILTSQTAENYIKIKPIQCRGCTMIDICKGGCKASAEVYYHDIKILNPFIKENFKKIL